MSLPGEFLDELKIRVGLAAVIGRRVKLVRAGRELKGCCPFHGEKTPSFFVNEEKGFYHCFGCGAHGDVIRFVMEHDGLDFMETVRLLAADAGLELPAAPAPDPRRKQQNSLRDLVEAANQWFQARLRDSDAREAHDYLRRRGIGRKLAQHFQLGLAPDSRTALLQALRAEDSELSDSQLIEAGLAGEADGRLFDRFRNRLIFPIHDPRGRAVGFGGRMLGDAQPKYLNSADGPLFHKGSLLYNYHRAAPSARKSGQLLIVEGYMDVVGVTGAGMAAVVAPLGTALTEDQIHLAWRLVAEPVLAFDGDAAGTRAALRAATRALPLITAGHSLAFATLPAGQDPDDLARAGGPAAIAALLETAQPLERFLFDAEKRASPLDTPERRADFRKRLRALAADIADADLRRDYVATWLGRADELLRPTRDSKPWTRPARGSGKQRGWQPPISPARPETMALSALPTEIHMAMLLRLMADRPDLAEHYPEELAELPLQSPALARARDHLLAGQPPGELLSGYRPLSFGPLSETQLHREIATTLAQCLVTHQIDMPEWRAVGVETSDSLTEAYARNRAAALDLMKRRAETEAAGNSADPGQTGRMHRPAGHGDPDPMIVEQTGLQQPDPDPDDSEPPFAQG